MKTNFKLLTLASSLLACGLGISSNAHANAYAVATMNIDNGFIVGVIDGSPVASTPLASFGNPSSSSSSGATLNGVGGSANSTTPPPDANASNGTGSNPLRTNEDVTGVYYNLFGQLPTAYSWSDSIIVSEQSATGTPIEARSGAESNIPGTGFADANGTNTSSTTLTVNVIIGDDCSLAHTCQVAFSFDADPFIQTVLDAQAAGTVARGTLGFNITLTPVGSLIPVFAWQPNGNLVATDAAGGTELGDAENLNITQQSLTPGVTQTFSPAYAANSFGSFSAITANLLPGSYTLGLTMTTHTDVNRVPEPASLALLGLGLTGMGFLRRRKQA